MTSFSNPETTSPAVKEIKSGNDGPLPTKRKHEPTSLDKDNSFDEINDSSKKKNLGVSSIGENDASIPIDEERKDIISAENGDQEDEEGEEDDVDFEDDVDEEDSEGEDEYGDEEEDEDDNEDEDDEYGHVNGASDVVDRKGKGIIKDEKGKGKLIEESEESSICASDSDGDSDLSDDPLAEVDPDNILSTRTRRCNTRPGVNILNVDGNKVDQDDGTDRKF